MIVRAITIDVINEYIIAELGKLFGGQEDGVGKNLGSECIDVRAQMEEFEHTTYSKLYGKVKFIKEPKDDFVRIHLSACRYGYDFFNEPGMSARAGEDREECAVCYEETDRTIRCGHRICENCVTKIMNHNKKLDCPLCRRSQEDDGGLHIRYPGHLMWLLFA